MTLQVRRVVTGHDASGNAVLSTDETLTAVSRGAGAGIAGCEIWGTEHMPVDNSPAAEAAQRAGFVNPASRHKNYVGTGDGTVIRITEWAPGAPRVAHRTETVDYGIVLSGEIDLECDEGEVAHLKAGDVVIQRGTMHTWVNTGSVPAVVAFVLIDAKPVEVNGTEMRAAFPA
jgi:quercetin dioxygenase-like cupin family protein